MHWCAILRKIAEGTVLKFPKSMSSEFGSRNPEEFKRNSTMTEWPKKSFTRHWNAKWVLKNRMNLCERLKCVTEIGAPQLVASQQTKRQTMEYHCVCVCYYYFRHLQSLPIFNSISFGSKCLYVTMTTIMMTKRFKTQNCFIIWISAFHSHVIQFDLIIQSINADAWTCKLTPGFIGTHTFFLEIILLPFCSTL